MKTLLTTIGLVLGFCVGVATTTNTAHADHETTARSARTTTPGLDASGLTQRGEHLALRVAMRLDVARREHDRLRAVCLDDTLSELHAALRIITHEAGREMTPERARVLHRVWTARLRVLDTQAMACERNGDVDTSGQTRVITTIDPSTPDIDPTILPRERGAPGDRR